MTFEKEQKIIIISNRKVERGEEVRYTLFCNDKEMQNDARACLIFLL